MIYTCTLNPSIDYIVHVDGYHHGQLNRGTKAFYYPGGKGINVSRVLKRLNVDNTALGFVGGFTGNFIKERLAEEAIDYQFIEIPDFTRINMKLKSGEETEINGPGPTIMDVHLYQLLDQIQKLNEGDYLVAAGSIPASVPQNFYTTVATSCKERGIHLVVDTSSQALQKIVGQKLFLVKPNHHELGELFDTTITNKQEALYYGEQLVNQGAEHVIISMGGEGAIYINAQMRLQADPPSGKVINTVGAGDSMVSGFVASFMQAKDPEQAFRYSVASGSATAFSEDLCEKQDVETLQKKVILKKL